jgi:predicted metalloprotease with PDZ domain
MAQGIGFTIGLQSEMPEPAISSSDHSSFLKRGVPALHLFSGIHGNYHRTSDSIDLIDLDGMSQISLWVEEALTYLADNVEPLRVTLANASPTVQRTGLGNREASLGTMPDFNYSGDGIRVEAVLPESAASAAGLLAGDVLLSFNNVVVDNLQVYSNLLRESEPGDNVRLEVLRGQELIQLSATLRQR